MAPWNPEGFKVGLCGQPPAGVPTSLTCLANNCCIRATLERTRANFLQLRKRQFYLHHYTEYMY